MDNKEFVKFINNYRQSTDGVLINPKKNDFRTNKLTFRDTNNGEKTGRQQVTLMRNDGTKDTVYLVVPERESVGYGYVTSQGNGKRGYQGKDKPVGMSLDPSQEQGEGQILGMVDREGRSYTAKGTQDFFQNLGKFGYKKIVDVESPLKEQEHSGPAYVPGDVLLNLFGAKRQAGSVGYTFDEPQSNSGYQRFIRNIRGRR